MYFPLMSLSFCYISDIFNGITKWQYLKLHFLIFGLGKNKYKVFIYFFLFLILNLSLVTLLNSTSFNSWIFLEMSMYTIMSYTNDISHSQSLCLSSLLYWNGWNFQDIIKYKWCKVVIIVRFPISEGNFE